MTAGGGPVLEHAVLEIVPGREAEFEAAFDEAVPLLAASEGCRTVRLSRCVEEPGRYLLLVEWDSVEAHAEGFRGSPVYDEWRRLLHHFWEPRPTVEHFATVATG
ncbi:MAG: antibiotic biosynthesis monooxygenase family protein [Acidimicrobiales bacterium]